MKNKKFQLFLLPFAGGNIAAFKNLVGHMDSSIEAIPIEYSGRGNRSHDPFFESYDEFLADVKDRILNARDWQIPYGILGYSMGGNIAYDLAIRNLLQEDPVHIFMCARDSVDQAAPSLGYYKLPDKEFVQKMQILGGIDRRIIDNERFLNIYLKPVRKDYEILGQFDYHETEKKLPSDLTVIYCEKDTPFENVKGWKKLTGGHVDYYEMGENHFFINQHYEEMAEIINNHVKKYLQKNEGGL